MTLRNDIELANTCKKLSHLEARYDALKADQKEDARVRELTLHSLKRLINEMKEEIARYETAQPVRQ